MKRLFLTGFAAMLLVATGCDSATKSAKTEPAQTETAKTAEPPATEPESIFTVDAYDPERDAVADLEMTKGLAAKSGKRILIEVGGKW